MRTQVGILAVFSLFFLMLSPAYASVTSMSLEKSFYTEDENMVFIGTQNATDVDYMVATAEFAYQIYEIKTL